MRAITSPKQKHVGVHFPAGNWFDYWDTAVVPKNGEQTVRTPVHASRVPVFVRSGAILVQKWRPRRNVGAMAGDPLTAVVFGQSATGRLYVDDGESHEYEAGAFINAELTFDGSSFRAKPAHALASASVGAGQLPLVIPRSRPRVPRHGLRFERIVFVGLPQPPRAAHLRRGTAATEDLPVNVEQDAGKAAWIATVKAFSASVEVGEPYDWVIELTF